VATTEEAPATPLLPDPPANGSAADPLADPPPNAEEDDEVVKEVEDTELITSRVTMSLAIDSLACSQTQNNFTSSQLPSSSEDVGANEEVDEEVVLVELRLDPTVSREIAVLLPSECGLG
jgi:hypothetical protein